MTTLRASVRGGRFHWRMHAAVLPFALALTGCVTAFNAPKLHEVDAVIEEAIEAKKIPGAVLRIEHAGAVYEKAYGRRALVPEPEPMTTDTVFDAASITKVVATAPSVWLLIQRGAVRLDEPAKSYLPEMADGRITIRHLLTHTSGLRPSLDLRQPWSGYEEGVRRAAAEVPLNAPGAVFRYSDIGFILLGEIVHRVSGEPLDRFAATRIFAPLGMTGTRYLPPPEWSSRTAPTERTEEGTILRGVVHDPTARRMGGVAGHAGVFTTAADLGSFARAVLRGDTFPREMTQVTSPPSVALRRAGGFDIDSGYSRPRGDHFPIGSFGHTGWTGGFLWIDPASRSFYVFLSNRVHPDGKGSVTMLQYRLGTLVAETLAGATFCGAPAAAMACSPRRVGWILGGADALNGIDVLHAGGYEPLRGRRVGLITNQSGIDRSGNPTIDLLRSAPGVELVALFSPEHGIRGVADDKVADSVDPVSGLPIYSLYGERRKPAAEQLSGIDTLVFDIQDVGTRFYTYISTMGLAMEAAAEAKIRFVVLDRVNPIGGSVVEGPMLEGETDFVGWHPLPVRHGMTVGELARMFADERDLRLELEVVPVRGWKREWWQDEAGLSWVNPSPNMRSLRAAALYPGIGILERAVSVGRGTPTPFEVVGAPWIDGQRLAFELRGVPGVTLTPVRFTPSASVHAGKECGGIRIAIADRAALRAVDLGLAIASALARLHPDRFPAGELAPLLRDEAALEAVRRGAGLEEIRRITDAEPFASRRVKYLMY